MNMDKFKQYGGSKSTASRGNRWGRLLLSAGFAALVGVSSVVATSPSNYALAGTVKSVGVYPINNWSVELDPSRVQNGAVCSLSRNFFKGYGLHVTRDANDIVSLILVPPGESDKWYGNIMGVSIGSENKDLETPTFVPRTKRFVAGQAVVPQGQKSDDWRDNRRSLKDYFTLKSDKDKDEAAPAAGEKEVVRLEYVLERHVSFYEDFMEESYINIELEKLSYQILLDGFADAMQLLEGCTITKTGRVSEYEEERIEREVKEFYQDNPALLTDLIRKGSDRSILMKSTQEKSSPAKPKKKEIDQDLVSSLTSKITILEREKEALRSRLGALEDSDLGKVRDNTLFAKEKEIYEKQISYLNKQIESLLQENSKVRQSKIRYKEVIVPANKEEMAATKKRLSALETQNNKLRNDIEVIKRESAKTGVSEQSAAKISALEEELKLLDRLNKRLSKRQEIMDILIANNVDDTPLGINGDVLALATQKQSLYSDTQDMDIQYKEQARVNVLGRMNTDLLDQVTDLEVSMMDVKEQNATLSAQNASLIKENEQLLKDINSLSEGYKILEKRIAEEKDNLDVPITADANITKMTYETLDIYQDLHGNDPVAGLAVQAARQDVPEELVGELKGLQERNQKLEVALAQTKHQSEQQYTALLQEHESLKQSVQDGADPAQAKQMMQMEKRVAALTEQNTLLVKELESLSQQTSAVKKAGGENVVGSVGELEQQISSLQQENKNLRDAVMGTSRIRNNAADFDGQAQLTDRIKKLNTQNMALVSEIGNLKERLDVEKQRVNAMAENAAIPQQLAERDEQIGRQKSEIQALIQENEALKQKIDQLASGAMSAQSAASCEAGNNMQQMNNRITALTHTNRMLSRKISELEAGIRPKETTIIQTVPQLDPDFEGSSQAAAVDANVASLRAENKRLKEQLESVVKATSANASVASCGSNQAMDVEEKIYLLEQENKRLKERLQQVQ